MKKILLQTMICLSPIAVFSQTTLLNENFESGSLPSTWSVQQLNSSETWAVEAGTTSFVAAVNYDESLGQQNEWLITPALDLSATMTYTFSAEVGLSYYWAVDPENNYDAFIKISTDGGASWTQLWSENNLGVFTNWTMNPVTLDLSSYSGNANVKLAFQYVGSDGAALYVDNVKVQSTPPPTTVPNCSTLSAPANGSTGVSASLTTLSWTSSPDAASYDVYMDTNADPTTLVINTTGTSYTPSSLALNTTYYWKVVPKNLLGSATGCGIFSFTTSAIPEYCGPLTFPGFLGGGVEPITLVNFAGINNVTDATVDGTPEHEFFLGQVGSANQGSTHTITLKGNTGGNFPNSFVVFIDWNQDGDFADADEAYSVGTITNSTGTDTKQITYDITVPVGATVGNTRMRIKKQFGSATTLMDPCAGATYGQAEDYTLNVGVLAVSETAKASVKSYPNPVKDIFNIEAQGKIKSVKVFDITGKQLLTKDLNEAKSQIDFGRFGAGTYVVTTLLEDGTSTSTKVIKK